MKKRALKKEFLMEIKNSKGRFFSILFIVAIGVSFFAGIRATEPDMRISGDQYFDERNYTDIQVVSTLGLTDEDIDALKEVAGIEAVEAGYSADVLCTRGESQVALHVMSLLPNMNSVIVEDGRLPENTTECVVDADFLKETEYEVGDAITFMSGTDDEITDTFVNDTYTIVGSVSSPSYISFQRGNTTIGTGSISGFVCVLESAFDMEVYTEIYMTVEGAKELTAFTDEYTEHIEKVKENIEAIREERENARYDAIVGEANEELDEAKQELEDAKAEADQEIADAQAEIDDGKQKLEEGKAEAASASAELSSSKKTLNSSQYELNQNIASVNAKKAELEASLTEVENQIGVLQENLAELESQKEVMAQKSVELEQAKQQYEGLTTGRDLLQAEYDNMLAQGAAEEVLAEMQAELISMNEAIIYLNAQITEGEAALAQGTIQIEAAEQQIQDGLTQLSSAKAQIEAGLAQIASAQSQFVSAQSQINSGWQQISQGEQELKSAQAEIAENEQKLKDAQAELDDAKADAEAEIADAEAEIADAEAEIAKIDMADWYINDRDEINSDYTAMGENADRMKALGKVFPVIFFMVAALICLTTMTRMVEEQRTQIGTLKALGYTQKEVAGKYLGYAFIATIAGSILGVLIGEKVYPAVIITAYRAMFPYVLNVVVPYEAKFALTASIAALACTVFATVFSCYKELKSTAAELMRPPAPKNGKRVFLERVPIIWKHLNFTWKATVRNLVRYKKRFFMTLLGIGGCMGLLLVGFGLRDSIFEIGNIQYHELQMYDASMILDGDATEEEREEACERLAEEDDIKCTSVTFLKQITIGKDNVMRDVYLNVPKEVEGFEEFVVHRDRLSHENYTLSDEGVILTEKMAKKLEAEVGDTIFIKDESKGKLEVKVLAICENYMQHYLYMTPALYEEIYEAEPEYNAVYYIMEEGKVDLTEKVGESVLKEAGALSISYTVDIEAQLNDLLSALNIVIVVLIIAAGMLAFVVLYNLNNINITERKRELATLKVLGFYPGEVANYVYRENIILTIMGTIVGCFIGKVLHQFTIETVEIDSAMFGRIINPSSYLFSFLITIGFAVIVNAVMYFKLNKINMVESLKSVE